MNRDFIDWLTRERMPMFDIEFIPSGRPETWSDGKFMGDCFRVIQRQPPKEMMFECTHDELMDLVKQNFPQLRTAIGELAVRTAIDDLRLAPWWGTAGPITEEIRFLLREGFKDLPRVLRSRVLSSPVKKVLDHAR